MRLRNVKGSREQIAANEYTIKDAEQIKGQWKDYFQDGKPIQLEIGMGKGKFLMQLAEKNPQIHYIGIEKYSSVLVRALEKMEENPLENLHFIRMDAENIVNVFECVIDDVKFQFIQLKKQNVNVSTFAYNMCQAWSDGERITTTKLFDLGVKKELLIETGELYSNTEKFKQKMIDKFPSYDYVNIGAM